MTASTDKQAIAFSTRSCLFPVESFADASQQNDPITEFSEKITSRTFAFIPLFYLFTNITKRVKKTDVIVFLTLYLFAFFVVKKSSMSSWTYLIIALKCTLYAKQFE